MEDPRYHSDEAWVDSVVVVDKPDEYSAGTVNVVSVFGLLEQHDNDEMTMLRLVPFHGPAL